MQEEPTLTVGELRKKLKNLPASYPVYMLTDKSDDNWDEDKAQWRKVHKITYVEKEYIYAEDGDEINVLLEIETP